MSRLTLKLMAICDQPQLQALPEYATGTGHHELRQDGEIEHRNLGVQHIGDEAHQEQDAMG